MVTLETVRSTLQDQQDKLKDLNRKLESSTEDAQKGKKSDELHSSILTPLSRLETSNNTIEHGDQRDIRRKRGTSK